MSSAVGADDSGRGVSSPPDPVRRPGSAPTVGTTSAAAPAEALAALPVPLQQALVDVVRAGAGLSTAEKVAYARAVRSMGAGIGRQHDGEAVAQVARAMAGVVDEVRFAASPAWVAETLRAVEHAQRSEG